MVMARLRHTSSNIVPRTATGATHSTRPKMVIAFRRMMEGTWGCKGDTASVWKRCDASLDQPGDRGAGKGKRKRARGVGG